MDIIYGLYMDYIQLDVEYKGNPYKVLNNLYKDYTIYGLNKNFSWAIKNLIFYLAKTFNGFIQILFLRFWN